MPAAIKPAATSTTVSAVSRARSEVRASGLAGRRTGSPAGRPDGVAEAAHRLDQRRLAGPVDLLAQVADVRLDDAGIAVEVVAPDVIEDLRLADNAAGIRQQVVEQVVLGRRQVDA